MNEFGPTGMLLDDGSYARSRDPLIEIYVNIRLVLIVVQFNQLAANHFVELNASIRSINQRTVHWD